MIRFVYESEKDSEKEKKTTSIERKGKGAERISMSFATGKEKNEPENPSSMGTALIPSGKKLERSTVMNLSKEV
jgi:hypothetical protein